jgi:ferredoxin
LLFPRSERLYTYDTKTGAVATPSPGGNIVLVGIRPCDVRGIERLDKVFLGEEYADPYYRDRRENLTMVALACNEPEATCFCDSIGGDPCHAPGADIVMKDVGDAFALAIGTERGERAKSLIASFIKEDEDRPDASPGSSALNNEERPGTSSDSSALNNEERPGAVPAQCSLKIESPDDLHEKLIASFDDPMWESLSEACLGCGCCSYICPTCYCFDIGRDNSGSAGAAFRCWDSCMFSDYSRMAGGHNPRPTKKERLRNRYLHKLAYFTERHGEALCVGCGRCIDKCPSCLDITNVPDMIIGKEAEHE